VFIFHAFYYSFQAYHSSARVVVTLDPSRFDEKKQRRLHIGNLTTFQPFIALRNQSSSVGSRYLTYGLTKQLLSRYPPDTTAFLYYIASPDRPRIAGELRLRVASSDDYASFESGSDLLRLDGRPWSRSLCTVSKHHPPLYEKLREEGLVSDDLDAVLSTFTRVPRLETHPIYTLNDPFIVDFSGPCRYIPVVTEQGMETFLLPELFKENRPNSICPFTGAYTNHHLLIDDSNKSVGSALVRFERSTLPDHKGTRTVVLRFLKIITSVKCVIPFYDGYIGQPKEGELYRRCKKNTSNILNPRPTWSANIDKRISFRSFQLLWDT
jgi:hypothetical protein